MNKQLSCVVVWLALNALMFFASSYVVWELNPAQWGEGARLVSAVWGVFTAILLTIISIDEL